MDEPAEDVAAVDRAGTANPDRRARWRKVKASRRSSAVVVRDVLVQYLFQVTPGEHEQVVEALFSGGAHPAFGEGVRRGCQLHVMETVRPEQYG